MAHTARIAPSARPMPIVLALALALATLGCQSPKAISDASVVSDANAQLVDAEPQSPRITLPIEVLGQDGLIVRAAFDIVTASSIDRLYLRCSRCGYRDSGVNTERGAKGSVSLNGGEWVDLSDETATVADPEIKYGGIAGSWHTVRFELPIAGAIDGRNELAFRFNGTDGTTLGYRIIELDILAGSESRLDPSILVHDDPSEWQGPLDSPQDVATGRALWYGSVPLVESPLVAAPGGELNASCSDCHAVSGSDLKYFNFSNLSIIERARFHGLSLHQGQQIATYIRSLESPAPAQARPWNPPYQPGPGLDAQPVEEWAAGAGLQAVLTEDAEMLPALFPGGTSEQAIAEAISTRKTLNVREQRIALQLPDWNAWLPEVHPKDIWGSVFEALPVYTAYEDALATLENDGVFLRTNPTAVGNETLLRDVLDPMRETINAFHNGGGAVPCLKSTVHQSLAMTLLGGDGTVPDETERLDPNACERPMRSITHWSAIKHWEIMQRFGLEDSPPDLYPYGEKRGWPGSRRQVFDLAPHRIGNDSFHFVHLNRAQSTYFNTAWYQLQVTLNAGNRDPKSHRPPDWQYQTDHLYHSQLENDHRQSLRYVQTLIKMHQNLDMRPPGAVPAAHFSTSMRDDRGPTKDGWWLTHVIPWRYYAAGSAHFSRYPPRRKVWTNLDDIEAGLRLKLQNAFLRVWLDKTDTYEASEFPRGDSQYQINPADYVPTPDPGDGFISDSEHIADGIYRVIPLLRGDGVDEALLERLRLFGAQMWPLGDWQALAL